MLLLLPCGYRPQRGRTGQRILPSNARPPHDLACQSRPTETPQNKPRRPPDDRWGNLWGNLPGHPRTLLGSFSFVLQGFPGWARQDSNLRPTDYETTRLAYEGSHGAAFDRLIRDLSIYERQLSSTAAQPRCLASPRSLLRANYVTGARLCSCALGRRSWRRVCRWLRDAGRA